MLDDRRPDDHPATVPATWLDDRLTSPEPAIAEPEVCPYLGLADDPRTRFTFADAAHRCHAGSKPTSIDLGHQGAYCLTTGYPTCSRFRSPRTAGPPASGYAAAVSPVSRDDGTSRGRSSAFRRAVTLLAILAAVTLIGALGVVAIKGLTAGGGALGAVVSPSTAATSAPTTAPAGTPTPTATPFPSLSATPFPSLSATPAATTNPVGSPIIHVVVSGETLTSIAKRYGVTAQAIQDENQIVNPNLIRVGQKLVIPPPP